jgi:hypothetical protein
MDSNVKDYRNVLKMLVDVLVMKINAPASWTAAPIASTLFLTATKDGSLPHVSIRYDGSRDDAVATLQEIVTLYRKGKRSPLALGRYITSTLMRDDEKNALDAFEEDSKDPVFELLFGTNLGEFRQLGRKQSLIGSKSSWLDGTVETDIIARLFAKVTYVRQTPSNRLEVACEIKGKGPTYDQFAGLKNWSTGDAEAI